MQKSEKAIVRRAKAGFTLVELLLVVAILGVLATVAVMQFGGLASDSRITATRASIKTIESAAKIWEIRNGQYPESIDQMIKEGLLDNTAINDQFGNPFAYKKITLNGKPNIEIRSAGPDGQMNTQDDITNVDTGK